MTHSGGRPHTNVGDRGQRYEVRSTGYPSKEQSVIGWADDLDGAQQLAEAIRKAPGCRATAIYDREAEKRGSFSLIRSWSKPFPHDPECRVLADYFLQDEPKLQHRADELAGEIQQTVEDWIKHEREEP